MKTILIISTFAIVALAASYSDTEQSALLAGGTKLADPALMRQDRAVKRRRNNKRRGKGKPSRSKFQGKRNKRQRQQGSKNKPRKILNISF